MAFQVSGVSNIVAEVETNTRAIRCVQRPDDYASLGIYSISMVSGTIAASLGANSNLFTFRNSTANVYLVRQVRIGAGYTNTAPGAAGVAQFALFVARSFTVNSSGGTAATITGNNAKRRTSMATTGAARIEIANTGAVTAGTWTLDAQPIGALNYPYVITTAGQIIMPPSYLWDVRDTEHPLVLAQNEGFTIQLGANAMPATATWQFHAQVDWLELASF